MKRLARIPGLPLLVKELVEQGARRRTYIVRVVYAVLLFFAFAIFFYGEVASRGLSYQMLGVGGEMFDFLLGVQLVGVYIFLPAMMAGVITYEKERRSLELLFITDLGPWEIVLQKLAGRLLPMFTFLLLSLPLMAITYSFGGVASGDIALGAYVLFTTCFQIGAFALLMSAYFRTSSEAILATYAGGVGLFAATGLVTSILAKALGSRVAVFPLVSIAPFFLLLVQSMGMPMGGPPPPMALLLPLPWIWTGLFLLGARRLLVSRAFLHAKKGWSLFRMLYDRLTRKKRGSLPGGDPIVWREVTRSLLGSPFYFVCTSYVLALPLLAVSFLFVWLGSGHDETLAFSFVIAGLWIAAALSVATRSASAFAVERTNRTLDILLTTPLTGREIVEQKAAVARRWVLLFVMLLGMLFLAEAWTEAGGAYSWKQRYSYRRSYAPGDELGPLGYLLTAFLSVAVYLSAVSWVARWIGLKVRQRARATTITLGVVFAWCVGPFVLAGMIESLTRTYGDHEWLLVFSPVTIVVCAEIANFENVFDDLLEMGA
ncbi:MAG: ABC transporter permease, partial [Planctomycetota bacterium]